MKKKYDVFGVGNALVDTLAAIDHDFLHKAEIRKGVMTLVDTESQNKLLTFLKDHKLELRSGGSAANTMIALANSGGNGCYTGKVADDEHGRFYKKDMEDAGIVFDVPPAKEGKTGTCVVLTTPDADRTMLTNLGISTSLSKHDIQEERLKDSQIAYIEGYLWDGTNTKEASMHTMELAKKYGNKVAFTYSDPFCVNRSREDFVKLTQEFVDIAFCNHDEAMAMTETDNPEDAIMQLGTMCNLVFMTWGSCGAFIAVDGIVSPVTGYPVTSPVDSNGAGDAFAAGVLYGLTHGYSISKACKWGNYVASKMIMEIGARLSISLKDHHHVLSGMA
ncbi:MAG TPA: adenosine kinase [Leptospiraceae bacterium]|nr:adenosine kinase [Leptospiraceae bacterium]HNH00704.1 adenosine kinase [Leptospiraceae bacterium]HNN79646.1 adenosine kinase [Leptospiraceae bacterium]